VRPAGGTTVCRGLARATLRPALGGTGGFRRLSLGGSGLGGSRAGFLGGLAVAGLFACGLLRRRKFGVRGNSRPSSVDTGSHARPGTAGLASPDNTDELFHVWGEFVRNPGNCDFRLGGITHNSRNNVFAGVQASNRLGEHHYTNAGRNELNRIGDNIWVANNRLVLEISQRQLLESRDGMILRRDHNGHLAVQRNNAEPVLAHRKPHEAHVHNPVMQHRDRIRLFAGANPQLDAGITALPLKGPLANGHAGHKRDAQAGWRSGLAGQLVLSDQFGLDQGSGLRQELAASVGERCRVGGTVKQLHPTLCLQRLDRRAERLTRDPEGLCCPRKMQFFADSDEVLQLGDVHWRPFTWGARRARVQVTGYAVRMNQERSPQTMKPATAAQKLGIYLPAAPEEFQNADVTREQLAELLSTPPEWLVQLRLTGPHPRQIVASKLGVSTSGLARGGATDPLTTVEIQELLASPPEWLTRERSTQAAVRKEDKRIKDHNAAVEEQRAKEARHEAQLNRHAEEREAREKREFR